MQNRNIFQRMPLAAFVLSCIFIPLVASVVCFIIPIIALGILGIAPKTADSLGPVLSGVLALLALLLALMWMIRARLSASPAPVRQPTAVPEQAVSGPSVSEAEVTTSLATTRSAEPTEPREAASVQPLEIAARERKVHWLIQLAGWGALAFGVIRVAISFFGNDTGISCSNPDVLKLANQLYANHSFGSNAKIDPGTVITQSKSSDGRSFVCSAATNQKVLGDPSSFVQVAYSVQLTDRGDQFVVNLLAN